jgi:hypothetical protein
MLKKVLLDRGQDLTHSMHFTVKYPTGNSNAHFEYMGSCNTRYYN